jgi:hypothetical protein
MKAATGSARPAHNTVARPVSVHRARVQPGPGVRANPLVAPAADVVGDHSAGINCLVPSAGTDLTAPTA